MPVRFRRRPTLVPLAAVGLLVGGCAHHPFRTAAPAPPTLEPPAAVAAPAATLPVHPVPPVPSYADVDGRQLEASLTRSRQETQLLQEEIGVLREQLASTSSQLAQARATVPPPPPPPGGPAGMATTPATMQSALAQLSLPGVESRIDGGVVRLDIPADRLFEEGGASLVPGGAAILTQVAGELDRLFPGHFVGIEGHVDTAPAEAGSWGSAHQLTAARSATVFDFLTSHTRMHAGQMFLVAHGPNHPLVSNATAAGRARNRRIELVVYPERTAAARP